METVTDMQVCDSAANHPLPQLTYSTMKTAGFETNYGQTNQPLVASELSL